MTYPLTPIISKEVKTWLDEPNQAHSLLQAFGSPLNVMFPAAVERNLLAYTDIFRHLGLQGEIFYAYKANKSVAILKQLSETTAKIDVASEQELHHALAAGFNGSRIEATGPKNLSFLRSCILHGITINLNSPDELRHVIALTQSLHNSNPVPLFLRLKEFSSSIAEIFQKDVKFGFSITEAREAIKLFVQEKNLLRFRGFSFHLTTISEKERLIAIDQSLRMTLEALQLGLNPEGINIGGGWSLNHLTSSKEWSAYHSALKDSILDSTHPVMTWNSTGLGYWAEKGKIRGSAQFSSFYRPQSQFEELEQLLDSELPQFGKLSSFLQENAMTLFIEPGRSLLDQAGISIAQIQSCSRSLKGEQVLYLGMNRTQLNAGDLEFMSDPILLPAKKRILIPNNQGVFLSGNLCLPHDFMMRRKVFLQHKAEEGDLLVFINTAGYFMDFSESSSIQHPLAQKIAVKKNRWYLDSQYPAPSLDSEISTEESNI